MGGPAFIYWMMIVILVAMLLIIVILLIERIKLKNMAYKDAMTDLLNRNALNELIRSTKGEEEFAVLFLDLDQFKNINDRLGHHVGDLLIQAVGQRLLLFMSPQLRVFRIGGDEFLFVARGYDVQRAEKLAEQILYSLRNVYDIGGLDLRVTGSIGICTGTTRDEPLTLLKNADLAMYKAKQSGKNQYYTFVHE